MAHDHPDGDGELVAWLGEATDRSVEVFGMARAISIFGPGMICKSLRAGGGEFVAVTRQDKRIVHAAVGDCPVGALRNLDCGIGEERNEAGPRKALAAVLRGSTEPARVA